MGRMKKFVILMSVVAFAVGVVMTPIHNASADVAVQGGDIGSGALPMQFITAHQTTDSLGSFGPRSIILGFKIIATAATGSCTLYDAATNPTTTTTGMIDDLSEVLAGGTDIQIWPRPVQLVTDLSVQCTDAQVTVYF